MATFRAAGAIFGFGILVLVLGLFVAPMIGATQTGAMNSVSLMDGESEDVQQNLRVSADIGNNSTVNATVIDTTTFEQDTTEPLSEGNSTTLTLSGERIGVSHDMASQNSSVLTIEYPRTFGFGESTSLFYDHLGLLLNIVGILISITGVVMGVRLA